MKVSADPVGPPAADDGGMWQPRTVIPLDDALAHVGDHIRPLPPRRVPLGEAVGCVTTERVTAATPVPPFDNSAVDGFALGDVAAAPGIWHHVVATVAAGDPGDEVIGPGSAVRIMTGAPVPEGAVGVAMVEHATLRTRPDGGEDVCVDRVVAPGANIRRAGEDLAAGDVAVAESVLLRPAHLGVLASVGRSDVDVVRRPVVAVLSTGDELVAPGTPLRPGQIPDSNRGVLMALCRSAGADVVDLGLVGDDESAVEDALRAGAASADVIISSGGVSMGDFDPVKAVLGRIAAMRWMQLAIKPAKPFAFGVLDGVPVFGLPGNPVSSVVSFELLARPALCRLAGLPFAGRPPFVAVADEPFPRRADGRTHYVRVQVAGAVGGPRRVRSTGGQGSHQMSALAAADGLAVLPDGSGVDAGEPLQVIPLD